MALQIPCHKFEQAKYRFGFFRSPLFRLRSFAKLPYVSSLTKPLLPTSSSTNCPSMKTPSQTNPMVRTLVLQVTEWREFIRTISACLWAHSAVPPARYLLALPLHKVANHFWLFSGEFSAESCLQVTTCGFHIQLLGCQPPRMTQSFISFAPNFASILPFRESAETRAETFFCVTKG